LFVDYRSRNAIVTNSEKYEISAYVEREAREKVVHLEKVASERVGPVRHEIWDVHCSASRWWVITNPTNLYSQTDFKSRDVALTFHVGLSMRITYQRDHEVPVAPDAAILLPGSWRRWEQAFESYSSGDEAENFQSVGMRLRECLVSFLDETRTEALVPSGTNPPKGADFRAWSELLADALARSDSSSKLRSYLKKLSNETWEYVNWLTHAKNASRYDAEIALKIVEHLLGVFTASRLRQARQASPRCTHCGSHDVAGGTCERASTAARATPPLPHPTSLF
jgi:hypothetical protein